GADHALPATELHRRLAVEGAVAVLRVDDLVGGGAGRAVGHRGEAAGHLRRLLVVHQLAGAVPDLAVLLVEAAEVDLRRLGGAPLGALALALLVLRVALAVARVAPDRVPVPVAGRDLEAAGGVALVVGRAAERLVLGALVGLDLATVHTV